MVDSIGWETRTYKIIYGVRNEKHEELEGLFQGSQIRIRNRKPRNRNGEMVSVWYLAGRVHDHLCLAERLLADKEVKDLKY